ncbi:MAG: YkgJ family cysteine cluster protein [Formivibrio sp.]|nr:YkgJ family cysteine cluster protein [Formivibrio sp.]
MVSDSPCLDCGACCALFRVSFYWTEADDAPGGWVPAGLTGQLTPHLRYMPGTSQKSPHCAQLQGDIPGARCGIYANRPSPCRELEPFTPSGEVSEQCAKARAHHGLPPLLPQPVQRA